MRKRNGLFKETTSAFRAGLGAANLGAKAARDAVRAAFVAGRTAGGMMPRRRKR